MRKGFPVIYLRHFIISGNNIETVYKHAAVIFPLQPADLLFIQQIQGLFGNICHILMQIVFNHKLSELLITSHIGSNHDGIKLIGHVD